MSVIVVFLRPLGLRLVTFLSAVEDPSSVYLNSGIYDGCAVILKGYLFVVYVLVEPVATFKFRVIICHFSFNIVLFQSRVFSSLLMLTIFYVFQVFPCMGVMDDACPARMIVFDSLVMYLVTLSS